MYGLLTKKLNNMKRKFKNTKTRHVFFDIYDDGLLRCVYSKLTYTIDEAEKCIELTEIHKN